MKNSLILIDSQKTEDTLQQTQMIEYLNKKSVIMMKSSQKQIIDNKMKELVQSRQSKIINSIHILNSQLQLSIQNIMQLKIMILLEQLLNKLKSL